MEEQSTPYAQISLPLQAELGRCVMSVREILALSVGSIVTLSNPVGSKVTVFVGGVSFCSGDVMPRGSAAAVRITDFENRDGK
jgi:flagellar motor switch/type III secretory pathway protein FliN